MEIQRLGSECAAHGWPRPPIPAADKLATIFAFRRRRAAVSNVTTGEQFNDAMPRDVRRRLTMTVQMSRGRPGVTASSFISSSCHHLRSRRAMPRQACQNGCAVIAMREPRTCSEEQRSGNLAGVGNPPARRMRCPASAPVRQQGWIEEGRISGPSERRRSEDEPEIVEAAVSIGARWQDLGPGSDGERPKTPPPVTSLTTPFACSSQQRRPGLRRDPEFSGERLRRQSLAALALRHRRQLPRPVVHHIGPVTDRLLTLRR